MGNGVFTVCLYSHHSTKGKKILLFSTLIKACFYYKKYFKRFSLTFQITILAAAKHSVSFQIDPKFEPQTLPPLPEESTATTKFVFSLRTDPEKPKTSSISIKTTPTSQTTDKDITGTGSETNSPNPDAGTTTPVPEKKKKHEVKYTGHQPGAVAGTAIAMLLVGVSIGAGGTFYKFNGLPECMRI